MNTSSLVTESLTNKDVFISIIEINNSTQLAKKIRTFSFLNVSLKEHHAELRHTETMAGSEKPPPQSILGPLLHLEHQNPSPGLDEGDQ